jgi:hypothetical protein
MPDISRSPILQGLPDPGAIRSRLTELAREANFLRSLLRVMDRRPRGSRQRVTGPAKEVSRAS